MLQRGGIRAPAPVVPLKAAGRAPDFVPVSTMFFQDDSEARPIAAPFVPDSAKFQPTRTTTTTASFEVTESEATRRARDPTHKTAAQRFHDEVMNVRDVVHRRVGA